MWDTWWVTQAKRWMCRLNGAVAVVQFITPGYKSSALEGNWGSACCWSQVRLNGKQQVPSNWPWLSRRLHGCFRLELVNKWLGKQMISGTIATFLSGPDLQFCNSFDDVRSSFWFFFSVWANEIQYNISQWMSKIYFMFPFAEIITSKSKH